MIKITNNKNTEFLVEYVFKGENHIQTYYKIMGYEGIGIEKIFHGEYLRSLFIPVEGRFVLFIGCGDINRLGMLEVRELAAYTAKELYAHGIFQCCMDVTAFIGKLGTGSLTEIVLGLELGNYEYKAEHFIYGKCGQDGKEPLFPLKNMERHEELDKKVLYHLYGIPDLEEGDRLLIEALELAQDIIFARDMVNTPGNILRPMDFNRAIEQYLKDVDVETETIVYGQLKMLGFQGLYGIGGSSEFPPCLMILRYKGNLESPDCFGFVGKGVTCDTGGYCLKKAKSMAGIKGDMAGAAAVVGAIHAAAKQNLKVNIVGVLPLCENRISPSSHLPGDVITSYSGKTIEILDTDAEGRLILADAISYAVRKEKATKILDIATLTGAVWETLGYTIGGSMSDNDAFYQLFQQGLISSGEKYLRFPFGTEHEKMMESPIADLKNTGGDCCKTITGGLFLRHFTENIPWIHLDIAGIAWNDTPFYAYESKGGTGAGLTSLYYMLKEAAFFF